jgi:hypothetical protein
MSGNVSDMWAAGAGTPQVMSDYPAERADADGFAGVLVDEREPDTVSPTPFAPKNLFINIALALSLALGGIVLLGTTISSKRS